MYENAKAPAKWILNFKYKIENDELSIEEKEIRDSCCLIQSYVEKTRSKRHGQGI